MGCSSDESPLIRKLKGLRQYAEELESMEVPVYLQNIQSICFPNGMPKSKKVTLIRNSNDQKSKDNLELVNKQKVG